VRSAVSVGSKPSSLKRGRAETRNGEHAEVQRPQGEGRSVFKTSAGFRCEKLSDGLNAAQKVSYQERFGWPREWFPQPRERKIQRRQPFGVRRRPFARRRRVYGELRNGGKAEFYPLELFLSATTSPNHSNAGSSRVVSLRDIYV
jgi:hypothetical protein